MTNINTIDPMGHLLLVLSEEPAIEHYTVDELEALPTEIVVARLRALGADPGMPQAVYDLLKSADSPANLVLRALAEDEEEVDRIERMHPDEVNAWLREEGLNMTRGLEIALQMTSAVDCSGHPPDGSDQAGKDHIDDGCCSGVVPVPATTEDDLSRNTNLLVFRRVQVRFGRRKGWHSNTTTLMVAAAACVCLVIGVSTFFHSADLIREREAREQLTKSFSKTLLHHSITIPASFASNSKPVPKPLAPPAPVGEEALIASIESYIAGIDHSKVDDSALQNMLYSAREDLSPTTISIGDKSFTVYTHNRDLKKSGNGSRVQIFDIAGPMGVMSSQSAKDDARVEAIYRRIVKRYPDAATRRYVLAELASLDQSEGLRFSSETSGVKGTTYHPYSENIQAAPDLAVRN